MNAPFLTPSEETPFLEAGTEAAFGALDDGALDYHARCAIRDLIRVHGFDEARQRIAFFLMDEADRRH